MKTRNIAIDMELHQKLKILAATLGCDLQEAIEAGLTDWLDGELWKSWISRRTVVRIKAAADSTQAFQPVAKIVEPEEVRTIGSKNFVAPPGMEGLYK
jgi:hypothetical protein